MEHYFEETLMKIGLLLDNRKYDLAEKMALELMKVEPNLLNARSCLAKAYIGQKRFEEAEKVLKEVIEMGADYSVFYYQLAEFYMRMGRNSEALTSIDQAIYLDPEAVEYLYLKAVLLFNDDTEETIKICRELLRIEPDDAQIQSLLGVALIKLNPEKENKEAERFLENALQQSPNNADIFVKKGWAFMHQNDYEAASKYFKEALRLDPESHFAEHSYLQSLFNKGQKNALSEEEERLLEPHKRRKTAGELWGEAKNKGLKAKLAAAWSIFHSFFSQTRYLPLLLLALLVRYYPPAMPVFLVLLGVLMIPPLLMLLVEWLETIKNPPKEDTIENTYHNTRIKEFVSIFWGTAGAFAVWWFVPVEAYKWWMGIASANLVLLLMGVHWKFFREKIYQEKIEIPLRIHTVFIVFLLLLGLASGLAFSALGMMFFMFILGALNKKPRSKGESKPLKFPKPSRGILFTLLAAIAAVSIWHFLPVENIEGWAKIVYGNLLVLIASTHTPYILNKLYGGNVGTPAKIHAFFVVLLTILGWMDGLNPYLICGSFFTLIPMYLNYAYLRGPVTKEEEEIKIGILYFLFGLAAAILVWWVFPADFEGLWIRLTVFNFILMLVGVRWDFFKKEVYHGHVGYPMTMHFVFLVLLTILEWISGASSTAIKVFFLFWLIQGLVSMALLGAAIQEKEDAEAQKKNEEMPEK